MTQQLVPNPAAEAMFPPPMNDVGTYFPLVTADPDPNTFEIGLVLGGTVSAAAYTAGVIDFLIQALDAWTLAKEAGNPTAPRHKVLIKILAGTSGGGITSVLLSRILGSAFPHCDLTTPATTCARNPLYDIWVNQIDIGDLLQTSDLTGAKQIPSLLCATKLDRVCELMANYAGDPMGTEGTPAIRDYFERWLPVVLTLTNLRGIPYSANYRGISNRPEYNTDHADHVRFLVDISGVKRKTNSSGYTWRWKPALELKQRVRKVRYFGTVVTECSCFIPTCTVGSNQEGLAFSRDRVAKQSPFIIRREKFGGDCPS